MGVVIGMEANLFQNVKRIVSSLRSDWLLSKMGLNGAAVLTKEKKVEPSRQDAGMGRMCGRGFVVVL